MDAAATDPEPAWTAQADELLGRFGSSSDGLSAAEAAERLARIGRNSLEKPSRLRWLRSLAGRFSTRSCSCC